MQRSRSISNFLGIINLVSALPVHTPLLLTWNIIHWNFRGITCTGKKLERQHVSLEGLTQLVMKVLLHCQDLLPVTLVDLEALLRYPPTYFSLRLIRKNATGERTPCVTNYKVDFYKYRQGSLIEKPYE